MGRMTVGTRCSYDTIGLLRRVHTLLVVSQLLADVTTQAVDRFDFLRMGDLIRLEAFMTGNTLEITVRGLLKLQAIYMKGNRFAFLLHREGLIPMTSQTLINALSMHARPEEKQEENVRDNDDWGFHVLISDKDVRYSAPFVSAKDMPS